MEAKFGITLLCIQGFLIFIASSIRIPHSLLGGGNNIVMEVNKVQQCNDGWNQIKILSFRNNIYDRNSRSFDVDIYFLTPVKKFTKGLITITKCREAVSFNTCESFATWRFGNNTCDMIKEEHAIWTSFVKSVTPLFRCPVQGDTVYKLRNGTINVDILNVLKVPVVGSIWLVEVFTANELSRNYSCLNMEVKFARIGRNKKD